MKVAARRVRVASRASPLAMVQTQAVVRMLSCRFPDLAFEIVPVTTQGDAASRRWTEGGPARGAGAAAAEPSPAPAVGAFVKDLEHALLDGRCHLAVHSLKDVPTELPEGLTLGAFPEREDPRDVLVLPAGAGTLAAGQRPGHGRPAPGGVLDALAHGARVGTSSLRRWVQLRLLRPDLTAVPVRGNVETRLRRLEEGRCDALVLAGAGLRRLGLASRIAEWLEPEHLVPAAGQGTLAVECRADDREMVRVLQAIDRIELRAAAEAERAFLARTGAGCRWPVGAWARLDGDLLEMVAFLAIPASPESPMGDGGDPGTGEAHDRAASRASERGGWRALRERRRFELSGWIGWDPARVAQAARRAGEALAEELLSRLQAGEGTFLEAPVGL